jgi:Amt family ammonium transporter
LPLAEVGGDFFDIMELKPGLTRILLADATGHGVQAALITMAIKTIYESLKRGIYSVNELLFYLNNEFLHSFQNLNQFFTCIIIDIDTNKNKIRYSSAGHLPQFLINGSVITKLEKTGRMVGVTAKSPYTSKEFEFKPDSGLFLFTDGLIEEWNADKEEFGENRLEELIQSAGEISIGKYVDTVLQAQRDFMGTIPAQDDISVIAIHRKKSTSS